MNYKQLYDLFLTKSEELCSEGSVVLESGTIKVTTRSGATLTSDNVLSALQEAEKEKQSEAAAKAAAAEKRKRRREHAAAKELEKREGHLFRQNEKDNEEEDDLQRLKSVRVSRRHCLDSICAA